MATDLMVDGAGVTESVEEKERHETHPSYSHVDGDVVLLSDDGIHFHVHSVILKRGSDFFRAMLDLPQPGEPGQGKHEPIRVSESSEVLVDLLNIIYPDGKPFPHILTLNHLAAVYSAAEKYDMPKAKKVVRKMVLLSPETAVKENPLELYVLACKFGWEAERKLALRWSLGINLHSPSALRTLMRLDEADDLVYLQVLQRARRQVLDKEFKKALEPVKSAFAFETHNHHLDLLQQTYLLHTISRSLDASPSGAELATEKFWGLHTSAFQTFICRSCGKVMADKNQMASTCSKILENVQDVSFDVPTMYMRMQAS